MRPRALQPPKRQSNRRRLTFDRGARIPDPSRLFNSGLDGNTRRAIDIRDGEKAVRVSTRFARALVVSTLGGQTLHRGAFLLPGSSKLETLRELGRNLGGA